MDTPSNKRHDMTDNAPAPSARLYFISRSRGLYAAIVVAASRAGIALPSDPMHYDAEQHPHWDFLVRFARRHALCSRSRSLQERVEEATTTARLYMDRVMCEGWGSSC